MLTPYAIVRRAAGRVARAADGVAKAYRTGSIAREEDFTSQMVGAIRERMNGYRHKGVRWEVQVLDPQIQEPEYGADLVAILDINISGYRVRKGFLAQAKRAEPNRRLRDYPRLRDQCEKMLGYTPASFILLYSLGGIRVVPAISILASETRDPYKLYTRKFSRFLELHFESFIGDRNISGLIVSPVGLADIQRTYKARHAMALKAQTEGQHGDR